MAAFLTIFRGFLTTFQRFPKIVQNLSKTTEGQYSSVRLELARLVSSLLYVALGPCLF